MYGGIGEGRDKIENWFGREHTKGSGSKTKGDRERGMERSRREGARDRETEREMGRRETAGETGEKEVCVCVCMHILMLFWSDNINTGTRRMQPLWGCCIFDILR